MKAVEEINELAEKKYGTDQHSFGGQREGFKEGFKQAQELQLLQSCVSDSMIGKSSIINALVNTMKINKETLGTYHNLRDTSYKKLMEVIESITV